MVHLVEVDVVGLQASQRALAGADDVARREERVVGPVAHRPVELGGDDHLLAAPATLREPAADDLLGPPLPLLPAVDVGGVEEVDALLEGAVHDGVRNVLLGRLGAEVHGAEAEAADGEAGAAQVRVFHVSLAGWALSLMVGRLNRLQLAQHPVHGLSVEPAALQLTEHPTADVDPSARPWATRPKSRRPSASAEARSASGSAAARVAVTASSSMPRARSWAATWMRPCPVLWLRAARDPASARVVNVAVRHHSERSPARRIPR